jgi:hypothetical protein
MDRPSAQQLDDWFQEWLVFLPDVLEQLIDKLPQLSLDYSPESLLRLEKWLLEQYPDVQSIRDKKEIFNLDAYLTYVGEVYKRNLKGKWGVQTDPNKVYFGRVIVIFEGETPVSPLSEVLASIDRRRGDYMYSVFIKKKKRMEEKGLL